LVRLIRGGGTCQIWEAVRDTQRVAIKTLQPEVRADREEINYLKHEFEVGRQLEHPDVIKLYEFGMDRGMAFLAMEYHAGQNVKMLIRQGPDAVAYLTQTIIAKSASGLKYVHEQRWVHRDVKPDNFLVDDQGNTKLIDFALTQRAKTGFSKLIARKSKVQGTRSYMAPEQIRGKAPDARADIYSFGCTLFELLSGKLPFTGVNPEDLLRKHLAAAAPPLLTANKNVTPDFNELVLEMMAKDPDRRPQTVDEFLGRFHAIRVFRSQPKPPEKGPSTREK
jgi:serine/threonine protein kinase